MEKAPDPLLASFTNGFTTTTAGFRDDFLITDERFSQEDPMQEFLKASEERAEKYAMELTAQREREVN